MRDVFHGWPRKAGCISLLISLTLMGAWIRSRVVVDTFSWAPDQGDRYFIINSPSGFEVGRYSGIGQSIASQFMNMRWESLALRDFELISEAPEGWETVQNWRYCGFGCRQFQLTTGLSLLFAEVVIWDIPHWACVLPLALFSACLLLSKPRKNPQA